MKKILLGTTALAAAGLLASQAQAAEPIKLSVGGYYQSYVAFIDVENEDVLGEQQEFYVKQEGEINFSGSTTLDNGLQVGVNVELEGYTTGDQIDEHFVWFEGTFGRIEIGAHDPAPYQMHYGGPSAVPGHGLSSPNFFHYPFSPVTPAEDNLAIGALPTTRINISADTNKIQYFTPRFNGFQLGISYAPDVGPTGGEGGQYGTDSEVGGVEDEIAVGLNFVQKFNDVALNLYAGAAFAESEPGNGLEDDPWQANVGGNVTFGGFTIGGSYKYDTNSVASGDNDAVLEAFEAGVQFAPSAQWAFSAQVYHAWVDANGSSIFFYDDDEFTAIEVGGRYVLGPGVLLGGGVHYYDASTDFGGDAASADGFAVFFGSTLVF